MVPCVYQALRARHEAQGFPASGWVFPTGSVSGHMEESSAKQWHDKALKLSSVAPFEPYCLRHTALTKLAEAGCDVFTLARIAGHSSIAITQRYVHPQSEAVELAFQKVVTHGGHLGNHTSDHTTQSCETTIEVSKG
jgi:integrase